MNYTLIGSLTSPFVRRIRLLMHPLTYHFKSINIFEEKDAAYLKTLSPINQIPVLLDQEEVIWDSKIIYQYLNLKHQLHSPFSLKEENTLTALERGLDASIVILLMQRSGFNSDQPFMYLERQEQRIQDILNYLQPWISNLNGTEWNFLVMTLYAWIDWARFRNIIPLDHHENKFLKDFLGKFEHRPEIQKTQIIG